MVGNAKPEPDKSRRFLESFETYKVTCTMLTLINHRENNIMTGVMAYVKISFHFVRSRYVPGDSFDRMSSDRIRQPVFSFEVGSGFSQI